MQTDSEPEVTAGDVLAAQARLRRWIEPTPLHHADRFGCWLKLENLQRTGAYKVRGALNALLAAGERGDRRGVIAASAGNHAQGMAWAARRLGVACTAVMPVHVPRTKLAGVARLGARVILHGDSFDQAQAHAMALAESHGLRYLHPFDDPDVIAGQGTVGLELAAFAPDVVLVPVGGGGLASGIALALHAQGVRIVGVQVKGVDAMALKIREVAGEHRVPIVENPPLARALYATVDIDEEIPVEHYQAVAEVTEVGVPRRWFGGETRTTFRAIERCATPAIAQCRKLLSRSWICLCFRRNRLAA